MDPIQLLAAAISGGLVQWVYRVIRSRYREITGQKRTYEQRINALQAALARNTLLAIRAGLIRMIWKKILNPAKEKKPPLLGWFSCFCGIIWG